MVFLAAVGYFMCTEAVNPDGLSAFVIHHLIPLGKQSVVCPIGISMVPWCISTKAVLLLVDFGICEVCGALLAMMLAVKLLYKQYVNYSLIQVYR